jgi:hypothetical protein
MHNITVSTQLGTYILHFPYVVTVSLKRTWDSKKISQNINWKEKEVQEDFWKIERLFCSFSNRSKQAQHWNRWYHQYHYTEFGLLQTISSVYGFQWNDTLVWIIIPCRLVGGLPTSKTNTLPSISGTTLKENIACSSKRLVTTYQTTRCHNSEDGIQHFQRKLLPSVTKHRVVWWRHYSTLMMKAANSHETLVPIYQTTRHHIPEASNHRKNLKYGTDLHCS